MKLSDFEPKHVQGLYSYDHFEAKNGAFIQRHAHGQEFVYQDADGKRQKFTNVADLKTAIEG